MDKVEKYRQIRRKSLEIFQNIPVSDQEFRSFHNVWKYNKIKVDEGAFHYALYYLNRDNEISLFEKYLDTINKDDPDYSLIVKLRNRYTSYFLVKELFDGYLIVEDLKTNKEYKVYDISFSQNTYLLKDGGAIIYSTIITVDDINFFAGYEILISNTDKDNYKYLIEKNKKRIILTSNDEFKELLATCKITKIINFHPTI